MSLDPSKDSSLIDEYLYEAELVEELGLDAIWLSEHHFIQLIHVVHIYIRYDVSCHGYSSKVPILLTLNRLSVESGHYFFREQCEIAGRLLSGSQPPVCEHQISDAKIPQ